MNRPGKNYFLLFIFFLVLYGSVTPMLYTLLFSHLEDYYWALDLVSSESFTKGNWYTLCATFLMLHAAYLFRPSRHEQDMDGYKSLYLKYRNTLFRLAVLTNCISILLNLFLGRSPSNLTAQRPPFAVYLGYFSAAFGQSAALVILSSLLFYKKLDRFAMIVVALILIQSATAWSRSGLFDICFFILLGFAYSTETTQIQIPWRKMTLIAMTGVIAIILGDMGRGASPFHVFYEALSRFYANNQALYLAIENPAKIYAILTDGQPRVLLQQLFSFAIQRTELPSSFRLLEYWGATIAFDETGHIAGYTYGWLGLTFGLFGWYGLIAIYLFFLSFFAILRTTSRRPTFTNLVFFSYFGSMLFEFFQNLGLDSYFEKVFKCFVYAIFYSVVMKILTLAVAPATEPRQLSIETP